MSKSWADWVRHHAMLFALLSDRELAMVGEWAVDLGLMGWTADELWEASDWLSRNDPPSARAKHLKALQDRLPLVRQQRARQEAEDERPVLSMCVDCKGDGLVSVPSLRPDPLGRGIFYTMAVACHCALGRWKQQHCFGEKGILDMAEYEAQNLDWKRQMADHERLLRRQPQTAAFARSLDEALGKIRRRQAAAPTEGQPCVSGSL